MEINAMAHWVNITNTDDYFVCWAQELDSTFLVPMREIQDLGGSTLNYWNTHWSDRVPWRMWPLQVTSERNGG